MPIYISRELNDEFQSDAIGRQADLTRESIAAAPPIPDAGPPPPPPPPDQPPQPAPAAPTPPSDSLTNPTGQSPPDLQDLMAAAGLAQSSGGAAAQPTQAAAAPVSPPDSSGGPPPLQNLLQSAGLGDGGGAVKSAVSSAVSAVSSAAPPPLQDLMRSAGLADTTPAAATTTPQQAATTPTPTQSGDVFPIPGWNGGKVQDHWGEVKGGSDLMAARGTPVVAMHDGKVIEAGFNSVGGNSVLIQGDDGNQYYYAHFDKPPSVSVGDTVAAGTFLGPVGNTGDADHGPTHLHIGIGPSILLGADKNGGTGGSFDAVGKLQGALDGTQQAAAGAVQPQPVTQTTAGMSGGGALAGQVGDRGMQILSGGAQVASWLGDEGQKALQAVLVTEGGLNNARGDQGRSAGPLQFLGGGGQLDNLAGQLGMTLDQAKNWAEQNPIAAIQWAIGTPDKPGYLGAAIQRGLQQGLTGSKLATFAQAHGQVSESPERAGANWNALFGGGQNVLQAAGNVAQGAAQAVGGAGQDLAARGAALVKQGQDLIDQANGTVQSVADYTRAKLAPINAEADRLTAANQQASDVTLQANQQAQDQRSVAASQATLGGGLRGRSAEFTAGGDGGQTPEQIMAAQSAQPPQSNNPLDLVKQKFSDALDALGGLFGGGQPAPSPQPAGLAAIPAEGGGFGTAGAPQPAATDLGPIGGAVQGVKSLTDQIQSPGTGNPLVDVPGVALSALGTGAHAISQGLEQVSPLGGGAVSIAGSDQMAQEFAARGGLQLQAQLQDLQQRRLNGEQGLEPQILDIGTQLTRINQDLTQGKPFNQAVEDAAQRNPNLPALQATAGIAAAGAATPLAAEGAPLVFRAIAEVLQPGTNPLEIAHQATSLLGHADVAGPATRQAIQDAFTSFGLRWSDSAAQREQMLSRIGDTRGFLQRVQDNLASAAQGVQGAVGDLVQGRQGAQAMVQDTPETAAVGQADRFYHGTGGDFARPDAARFDPNGLFGPGYYLTDDPRVAGGVVGPAGRQAAAEPSVLNRGYAQQRAPDVNYLETTTMQLENNDRALQTYRSTLAEAQRTGDDELANSMTTKVQQLEQAHDALQANVERATAAGPNVRPVDVPQNLNLFDAEAEPDYGVFSSIDRAVGQARQAADPRTAKADAVVSVLRDAQAQGVPVGSNDLYLKIAQELPMTRGALDQQGANNVLARAGFDGIRYEGGNRIPMADAAGTPIQHTALVIFPDALDKLRNAVAGTAGGRIAPTFATDVAGATAGGVAGNQSTPDDASPLERGARIAAGAALGGTVAHAGVGALLRARGLPIAEDAQPLSESAGRLAAQVQIGNAPPAVQQVAQQLGAAQNPSRAFDLNALAQMRAQFQSQQPPLLQAVRKAPGVLDRFIGYTISNMLWGVGTATHITTSQALQTLGRPIITAASGHPVDAVRDATAMASSISDAFARFGRTIQTGQRQGLALQSPAAPTAAEQVLQFPLRLHSAINEFYRTLNAAGGAAMEASRRLRENPDLSFQDVLQRYPQQITDAGANAAARATFMEGGGAMKDIGAAIGKVSRDFMDSGKPEQVAAGVVLRWIVPMTHIPAVILGEGIRGLPVVNEVRGIQRATQLARSGQHFEAQQEIGRTALTSFANMAILNEVAQGNITGDGPTSLAEKQRLMEGVDANGNATWRPNSVRLPDGRWLDYTGLGPVALSMSSVANSVEAAKDYLQKPPEQRTGGIPEFAQDMIGREMGTIGQTWFLRGLADVLTAVKEGTVGGTGTQISQAGDRLVPFGALLNEVRGMTDPLARNPQGPLERIESRLPFVSENVQPRLAATTGQPEQQPRDLGSVLFRGTPPGMMTPNPVADEVNRLSGAGLNVSVPYEVKSYKGAQQTPEAQQTIRAQVGQAVNQYVLNTISDPKYQALDDAQKANAITSAIGQARSAADITLDQQVARSPHDSALLQWAQTAQYAGIPRGLPPEEVARQNWAISQAKQKMAEYRAQYKDRAEGMLRRDDPEAYRLSQRDRLDTEILNKRKAAIDKATGGALSQAGEKAASGGLVGTGSSVLPPLP